MTMPCVSSFAPCRASPASARRGMPRPRRIRPPTQTRDEVPMERLLGSCQLAFRHAFARIVPPATGPILHAVYRELLNRCSISAVAAVEGEFQSAPYNLLVRRGWMLVVPRSRACFESIPVNALG